MNSDPLLVVLSGPSGVGKDSILERMRADGQPFHFTVTATTRPPRPGERDGIDYFFYTEEQFQDLLDRGGFLEHAPVYAHRYGVPKEPVLAALARGEDVIMRTDVQGAATIQSNAPGAILIFIAPPSEESLLKRMRRRDADTPADVALRLGKVRDEMASLPLFDYVVVNDEGELDRCAADVEAIVRAEKLRARPRPLGLTSRAGSERETSLMRERRQEELAALNAEIARLQAELCATATEPAAPASGFSGDHHEKLVTLLTLWRRARMMEREPDQAARSYLNAAMLKLQEGLRSIFEEYRQLGSASALGPESDEERTFFRLLDSWIREERSRQAREESLAKH